MAAAMERDMNELPFAATTPISVAQVGLKARDAKALADYYSATVGLEQLSADGETITLGAKGRSLLVIESNKAAYSAFAGKRGAPAPGTYRVKAVVIRDGVPAISAEKEIEIR